MAFKVLNPFPTPSKYFVVDQEIGVEELADAPREPAFYVEQGYLLDLTGPPAKKAKTAPATSDAADQA